MPVTAADRELVLRTFGETKVAKGVLGFKPLSADTPASMGQPRQIQRGSGDPKPLVGNVMGSAAKTAAAAKSKEKEEKETEPEVVDLALASDTPVKKAPEKKPEEESENKAEYTKDAAITEALRSLSPLLKKLLLGGGIGAGVGGVRGALNPGAEPRLASALRGGVTGAGIGAGAGAGAHFLPKLLQHLGPGAGGADAAADFATSMKAAPYVGGAAGGLAGGAASRVVTGPSPAKKEAPKAESAESKKPKAKEPAKEAALLISAALREAGQLPDDAAPSASDTKPDKQAPQQKAVKLDEGGAPAAPSGDIPVLGATGGHVLGGLEKLLGGIGWEGGQRKLQEWGQSPTARNIAGGTTATLAAIITALAARKALGRGGEDDMYAEAALKLRLVKRALMGQGVPAFKDSDGKNEQFGIPTRAGVTSTRREAVFGDLDRWSRGR
jgi:hypothetical protein